MRNKSTEIHSVKLVESFDRPYLPGNHFNASERQFFGLGLLLVNGDKALLKARGACHDELSAVNQAETAFHWRMKIPPRVAILCEPDQWERWRTSPASEAPAFHAGDNIYN